MVAVSFLYRFTLRVDKDALPLELVKQYNVSEESLEYKKDH